MSLKGSRACRTGLKLKQRSESHEDQKSNKVKLISPTDFDIRGRSVTVKGKTSEDVDKQEDETPDTPELEKRYALRVRTPLIKPKTTTTGELSDLDASDDEPKKKRRKKEQNVLDSDDSDTDNEDDQLSSTESDASGNNGDDSPFSESTKKMDKNRKRRKRKSRNRDDEDETPEKEETCADYIDSEGNFQCEFCPNKYKKKFWMVQHIIANHVQDKEFQCTHCPKSFLTEKDLHSHIYCQHEKDIWKCGECPREYKRKRDYEAHLQIHQELKDKNIPCKRCEENFSTWDERIQHLRNHTALQKKFRIPIKCVFCPQIFQTFASWDKHNAESHDGTRNFRVFCEICGRGFYTNKDLQNYHMPMHTGERKFKCDKCSRAFKTPACLRQHKRNHCPVRKYGIDSWGPADDPEEDIRSDSGDNSSDEEEEELEGKDDQNDHKPENICIKKDLQQSLPPEGSTTSSLGTTSDLKPFKIPALAIPVSEEIPPPFTILSVEKSEIKQEPS